MEHNTYQLLYIYSIHHDKKIKFTLVQALRLCTGRAAQTGSISIALLFLDYGVRNG